MDVPLLTNLRGLKEVKNQSASGAIVMNTNGYLFEKRKKILKQSSMRYQTPLLAHVKMVPSFNLLEVFLAEKLLMVER